MFLVALCGVAMLIGASSCKKEKQENENGETMTIKASLGSADNNSKTHLVGPSVIWDPSDAFKLFPTEGKDGTKFSLTRIDETDGKVAYFEGKHPGGEHFYACYPCDVDKLSCEASGVFKFQILETQPGVPEMVDEQPATTIAGPMVGYMDKPSGTLVFKNAMSWLKVGLKGNAIIKRVVLTDKNNCLNGTLTVRNIAVDNNGAISSFDTEMGGGTKQLEIVSNEGFQLNSTVPTYFWFQVPAGSLASLNLSVYASTDVSATAVLSLDKEISGGVGTNSILTANVNTPISATRATVTTKTGCSNDTGIFGFRANVNGKDANFTTYTVGVCYNPISGETPTIDKCEGYQEIGVFTIPKGTTMEISYDVVGLTFGQTYKVRAYATNGVLAYGETKTLTVGSGPVDIDWEGGHSPLAFSVGGGKSVYFSQGNLQFIGTATPARWQFAAHQSEFLGAGNNSADQNVDRDLFGWGDLTGYNTSTSPGAYQWTDDWGSMIGEGWRTLTREEWMALFGRSERSLYGFGKVGDCTFGVILLPDDWDWTKPSVTNFYASWVSGSSSFINKYSFYEWAQMEAEGAVFLPCAGNRSETTFHNPNSLYYWSSTNYGSYDAYNIQYNGDIDPQYTSYRSNGFSVRLVKDAY